MSADHDHLKTCDVCYRTEIDDLLEGKPDLIPMRLDAAGCWLCPDCDDWVRDGMPAACPMEYNGAPCICVRFHTGKHRATCLATGSPFTWDDQDPGVES